VFPGKQKGAAGYGASWCFELITVVAVYSADRLGDPVTVL